MFDTFELIARSATLDGSIPVRAAQGCKPLLDRNSAGLHFRARGPAMIQQQDEAPSSDCPTKDTPPPRTLTRGWEL